MDKKLFIQAITKFIFGFIIIALLLFIPAGTLNYWNAWLFIGILFVPMFMVGIILLIKNPDLLRKRLNSRENESEQKVLLVLGGFMFIGGFVFSGLNYRFQWMTLPKWMIVIATIIFLLAYLIICRSFTRKYVFIKNYRSARKSKSNRYRTVWNCKASHVCFNDFIILIYTISAWFTSFIFNFSGISSYYSKKN